MTKEKIISKVEIERRSWGKAIGFGLGALVLFANLIWIGTIYAGGPMPNQWGLPFMLLLFSLMGCIIFTGLNLIKEPYIMIVKEIENKKQIIEYEKVK